MLTRLYVDNFRNFVKFEIRFSELSLLLGENGSGKSTVFEAISRIRDLLSGIQKVREAFPPATCTRWMENKVQTIELDMMGGHGPCTYRLLIEHEPNGKRSRIASETLTRQGKPLFAFEMGQVRLYRDDHSEGPSFSYDWQQSALAGIVAGPDNRTLTWFKEQVGCFIVTRLVPMTMSTDTDREDPILSGDGRNFVSWFRFLSQEHQDKVFSVTERLRDILPGFRGFRLPQAGSEHRKLEVLFGDEGNGRAVPYRFDELSDGQRVLIVLYMMLYGVPERRYTLFLDEPDNYLALPEIQPWLMELKDACGETVPQAVLISHHPELIDYLGPESGIWLCRDPGGPTRLEPLPKVTEGGLKLSELIARGWTR